MRDKRDLAKSVDDGRQAEAILSHPLLIASLQTLREVTVNKFEGLGVNEIIEMQACNQRLNLINELEVNLTIVMQSGEIAFQTLEEIQTHEQAIKNER